MAIGVLIIGESGTGKSTSLRNFGADEISIINVSGKPLPFRGKFTKSVITNDAKVIIAGMQKSTSKVIVIDDSQYIMGFAELTRRNEKGFQKFNDIGGDYFDIMNEIRALPDDVIVYMITHAETTQDGIIKAKSSGQMLDKKICIEGLFSIVLRTAVKDGKYLFLTHNSGFDTVKSPMGLFEADEIDNDLKAVDSAIRAYYEM